jgi:hypothetical protein
MTYVMNLLPRKLKANLPFVWGISPDAVIASGEMAQSTVFILSLCKNQKRAIIANVSLILNVFHVFFKFRNE